MQRIRARCDGEIGLWGHFIALSEPVLREVGTMGTVIPINVLCGRESETIRDFLSR